MAVARSFVSPLPAKVAYTASNAYLRRVLEQLRRDRVDIVILNGSDLLWLNGLLPLSVPRLVVAHNLEHLLFATQAAEVERLFAPLRLPMARELRRMEEFETAGISAVGNGVFLSADDAAHPRGGGLAGRVIVIPPVFPDPPISGKARPRNPERIALGFLGNMNWWPNRRGLSWFLKEVFPHLSARVQLHLFGDGTRSAGADDARIIGHGRATDFSDVWSHCDLMICPMHWGAGVSIKLAEAVYHGVPTLTTRLATRGLPLASDPSLVVLDSAREWVEFLQSDRVREVMARRIAPILGLPFTVEAQLEHAQRFVLETVMPGRARAAVM
jgi:hypothetical protein